MGGSQDGGDGSYLYLEAPTTLVDLARYFPPLKLLSAIMRMPWCAPGSTLPLRTLLYPYFMANWELSVQVHGHVLTWLRRYLFLTIAMLCSN